uniref:MULE transposase domain-containing protein n=1 Tax=Globodera rostochiensis TaxID=31243 RepID=A0A914GTB3_GLORO
MFHFGQSLVRKWKDLGLEELYGRVDAARHTLRTRSARILFTCGSVTRWPPVIHGIFLSRVRGYDKIGVKWWCKCVWPRCKSEGRGIDPFQQFWQKSTTQLNLGFLRRQCPVSQQQWRFWNVHRQPASVVARTNNALESSHLHFTRDLNNHPALSDFLRAVSDDADKQHDIYRSARLRRNSQHRHKHFVLQEQAIMATLQDAEYGTDIDLLQVVTLLGLQIKGYLVGLHAQRRESEFDEGSTIEQNE